MYVLQHKDRVIVGPMGWNRGMFESALEDLGISLRLGREAPVDLPMVIDADTSIKYANVVTQPFDADFEYLHGPFWNLGGDVAQGSYQKVEHPLNLIKGNLKNKIKDQRYKQEVAGTKTVIAGIEVTVETDRETRNVFVQQYLLMGDNDTVNWKFPETWVQLTKPQLGQVVQAGAAYIQSQFNWELNKVNEVDSKNTVAELKAIEIVPAQPQ